MDITSKALRFLCGTEGREAGYLRAV